MLKLNETLEKRLAVIKQKLDVLLLKLSSIYNTQSNLAIEKTWRMLLELSFGPLYVVGVLVKG